MNSEVGESGWPTAAPAASIPRRLGRVIRSFPDRWRKPIREALAFGVVGIVNMLVNFVAFNLLVLLVFRGGELKANVVATTIATTSSYLMNRYWTFRHRPRSGMRREYPLFFLLNGAGLGIELAVMGLAKYGLGLTGLLALNIAKATGIGLGTIFRFWSYRTFVFTHRGRPAPAPAASAADARPATATAAQTDEEFAELAAPLEVELAGPLELAAELELKTELKPGLATERISLPRDH